MFRAAEQKIRITLDLDNGYMNKENSPFYAPKSNNGKYLDRFWMFIRKSTESPVNLSALKG